MPTIITFLNKYWTLLLIALMAIYIVYTGNNNTNTTKNDDRIDSILRILSIPEKSGEFTNVTPQPTIIVVPQPNSTDNGMSNALLKAFNELKDDNAKTRAYAEAIARRVYNNSYSDSIVSIDVQDVVEGGKLTKQDVKWKVKPQEIKYNESIYYMKPQYTISVGGQIGTSIDAKGYSNPQLMPTLGYKGRNGWGYTGSINLLNTKEFMIGVNKDILIKYNKIPKSE